MSCRKGDRDIAATTDCTSDWNKLRRKLIEVFKDMQADGMDITAKEVTKRLDKKGLRIRGWV